MYMNIIPEMPNLTISLKFERKYQNPQFFMMALLFGTPYQKPSELAHPCKHLNASINNTYWTNIECANKSDNENASIRALSYQFI